ncbi:cupin domain-containing protein [Microbulbifer sp. OS29]|uniref:Cupin domain-containing protein n=1 Tax=Microbulbifer okhotskensis TaxID=2926617 RepID=A0A9X2ESB9_9GAMM|nr:cupin domain-containing protein [Microbulbifer okhotskensis]MCO1336909.1 cupin domain-containing protein [Microbulbifer okhotskensis]
MTKSKVISIEEGFSRVKFLNERTPETTSEEAKNAFSLLSHYRDGGIYISYYSGYSEWEKHPNGDEFVQILEGKTTLILLKNSQELHNELIGGQIFVIPKGVWHRFESPDSVKVMTITPQPTVHSVRKPSRKK